MKNQTFRKTPNIFKLNSIPQNNISFERKITNKWRKYHEMNDNENTFQNS